MNAFEVSQKYLALPVRETHGKNRSPEIDRFNKFCKVPLGSPYCASGISYCFYEALQIVPQHLRTGTLFPYSASSQSIKNSFKKNGWYSVNPQDLLKWNGALFGWTNPAPNSAHGHIGMVIGRLTDKQGKVVAIQTLEFNTSPITGSRDGDGCYSLKRTVPVDKKNKLWFLNTTYIIGRTGFWWT